MQCSLGLLRSRLTSHPFLRATRVMGHLGERHHKPSFAGSCVSFPERHLDRGEEAAARRIFHQNESAQSQLLCHAVLRVRVLELLKFGK